MVKVDKKGRCEEEMTDKEVEHAWKTVTFTLIVRQFLFSHVSFSLLSTLPTTTRRQLLLLQLLF
jgi:hypothetical protein